MFQTKTGTKWNENEKSESCSIYIECKLIQMLSNIEQKRRGRDRVTVREMLYHININRFGNQKKKKNEFKNLIKLSQFHSVVAQ